MIPKDRSFVLIGCLILWTVFNLTAGVRTTCPLFKCKRCKHGFKLDKNGCQTCECLVKPCPLTRCSKFCLLGNVISKAGCKTCKCKPKACGVTSCATIKCPYGTRRFRAADGCIHCRCSRKCPRECNIFCPTGKRLDQNGCKRCACNPTPCPLRKCKPCKNGFKLDENGCQTCECLVKPCPLIKCPKFCLFGNVISKQGCKTCECKPKACGLTSCATIRCQFRTIQFIAADGCKHCRCENGPLATCPLFPAPPPDPLEQNCRDSPNGCPGDECQTFRDCKVPKVCCSGGAPNSPKFCTNGCISNCNTIKCPNGVPFVIGDNGCNQCKCK